MKLSHLALAAALVTPMALAQDGGITVWSKGVPPPTATRADFGDHTLTVGHRDKDGRVELHQNKADVLIVQSGSATLVTGGEVVDPVPSGPNEIQGSSIKGGVRREVGPGDVIEIPAGVPHQFFIAPGAQITYLAVKIVKRAEATSK